MRLVYLNNMNPDQFFNKYNGKFINYDGVWGFQCTDLMRQYVKEVFNVNPYTAIPTTGSAKNIFKNFKDNKYFKKVLNTPTGVPPKGSIIFFKTSILPPWIYGFDGHVAIVSGADINRMITFDQNYPKRSFCKFVNRNYKDCIGWLTPVK